MTKKEVKELEMRQANLRSKTIEELKNYWRDVEATTRYYKINDMKDKLTYNGHLIKEEEKALKERYELIKDLGHLEISVLRTLIWNREDNNVFIQPNEIYITDFVWTEEELLTQLNYMKKLGIKTIHFHDNSTAALREIVWLTHEGCQIIGTKEIKGEEGLVIEVK